MPRSPPGNLTVASFLKTNLATPSTPSQGGKKTGKKRKHSISPFANAYSLKKLNGASSPEFPALPSKETPLPLVTLPAIPLDTKLPTQGSNPAKLPPSPLPYQLRPSSKKANKKFSLSPSSRMDQFEMEHEDGLLEGEFPTSDEADALLRDDEPDQERDALLDSPTAAVRSAIEAQIAENLDNLSTAAIFVTTVNKDDTNASAPPPTLAPFTPPLPLLKKPQPLFPDGLPYSNAGASSSSSTSSITSGNSRGYFTTPRSEASKVPGVNPINPKPVKPTYASKAKSPPKARVLVQNILYVYSTSDSKKALSLKDWEAIDNHLILKEVSQEPGNSVKIAKSGYDSAHNCGYIACKNLASENWVKDVIRCLGGGPNLPSPFRAWSRGEQPETRICRLFFPARFDCLNDNMLVPILLRHNPSLSQGTITLASSEIVQGGRAVFLEMDAASYGYAKSRNHKLEFTMMDVDCQLYIPPSNKAKKPVAPPTQTIPPTVSPSGSVNPAPNAPLQRHLADPRLAKTLDQAQKPLVKSTPEKRKRESSGPASDTIFFDSAKKADTSTKPLQKEK